MKGWPIFSAISSKPASSRASRPRIAERDRARPPASSMPRPDLDVAQLAAQVDGLGQHLEYLVERIVPRAQYARISTVARPRAVVEPARHRDRVRLHERPTLVIPDPLERAGQPAEHHDAERRLVLAQRLGGLLQQLDGAQVDVGRPPARVLEADGGSREQLAVAELSRRCRLRLGTP